MLKIVFDVCGKNMHFRFGNDQTKIFFVNNRDYIVFDVDKKDHLIKCHIFVSLTFSNQMCLMIKIQKLSLIYFYVVSYCLKGFHFFLMLAKID